MIQFFGDFSSAGGSPTSFVTADDTTPAGADVKPAVGGRGERSTIESRIIGHDDKAVYMEQRFVRPDAGGQPEIYATGYIRARTVEAFGVEGFEGIPEWMERRGQDVALPATRAAAPSIWPSR